MKIRLIRHGLTWQGEQKKYQGALDTPLSDNGRKQLKRAEKDPEEVYVTPLVRTQETARILFPSAMQITVDGLREMNFGTFEGRSWQEMEQDAAYRAWVDGGCLGRCPGGEDRAAFSGRVCRAFDELLRAKLAAGEEELVIVAHGGTQMAILERWGSPARTYYRWQTACGHGWLLEAAWPGTLQVIEEVDFTR